MGRYQLVEELGRGGMGVVYHAHDPQLDRDVAVKVLPAELVRDETVRQRFASEARNAARLQHPGILTVYDVGDSDGQCYIVMQLVRGGDLADRLAGAGPMSVPEALHLLRPLADALDHAHHHGIVHRDIKPENVLIDERGACLLTDFGIARAMEGGDRGLTRTGTIVGTPEYMSPEQALGGQVDHRSDLYSFGVLAYRMLTGMVPFGGDSVIGVALRHVQEPVPDPQALNPELPAAAAEALRRALAKEPAARPSCATAFVTELAGEAPTGAEGRSAAKGGPSAPATRHDRRTGPVFVVFGLLLLGLAVIIVAAGPGRDRGTPPESGPPASAEATQPPPRRAGITVPNLLGLEKAPAKQALYQLGLDPLVSPRTEAGTPDEVLDQEPPAGAVLPPGAQVTLTVRRVPEPSATEVATDLVERWRVSVLDRDLSTHLSCYGSRLSSYFTKRNWTNAQVRADKEAFFRHYPRMDVYQVDDLAAQALAPDRVKVTFEKSWDAVDTKEAHYRGRVAQTLVLQRTGTRWVIVSEVERRIR